MIWKKYRLKIKEEAEDLVICALADAGVQGAEIEDAIPLTEEELSQMFVDIPPAPAADEGAAFLNFYLDPETEDVPAVLSRVREELDSLRAFCDIGEGTIEESETENKDWENEWKKYFRPFRIDDILIVPSWVTEEELSAAETDAKAVAAEAGVPCSDADAANPAGGEPSLILRMDPGTAFGTGMHETTQLCIRAMRACRGVDGEPLLPGARVLDVGTGSGILGILALKFGAASVLGTDLDPNAEPAVEENCGANGVKYLGKVSAGENIAPDVNPEEDFTPGVDPEEGFAFILGNLIDSEEVQAKVGKGIYDIVFSNILADVLVPLAPAASRALRPGGLWITSGILKGKEHMVSAAAKRTGLLVEKLYEQGEWCMLTARKPARNSDKHGTSFH